MRPIIHATSVIGCSISLLFCLLAVLVLSCYREKTRLLLIKQQQSITLVFINIVMLTGFQGLQNKELCQVTTTLLHYFVLACFSWLTADQYFIFKSVVKMKPYVNFMKIFVVAWGLPVPFLVMQLLIGLLLDQDIGSILYNCWGSDFVALTLLIPAGGLSIASITMLSITVKAVIKRPAPTTYTRRKTDQAIKYGIKTSSVMIIITVIVWIFAHLLFWYPDHLNFQLIFALSTGLQGLFNFFFYCVFALELDIYVSDKLFSENDDVDEFTRNTGSVKLSSINRQDIQNMESLRRPQKRKRNGPFFKEDHDLPPMIEEEPVSYHKGKTTPTSSRRLSDPLPWFPAATTAAKNVRFGANISSRGERQERGGSRGNDIDVDDEEASDPLLRNEVASPPPFLKPMQSVGGKDNIKAANSLLLNLESLPSAESEQEQIEIRRSSSLPSCSLPPPNKYFSTNDASARCLVSKISAKQGRVIPPPDRGMRRGSDIEASYLLAVMKHELASASLIPTRHNIRVTETPKVPIRHSKGDIETNPRTGRDSGNAIAKMKVQHYNVFANGESRADLTENSSHHHCNTPEINGDGALHKASDINAQPTKATGHRSSLHQLDKTSSYVSGADGSKLLISPKKRKRVRTSVPSLKFALNELESLFSNQDIISAAKRRSSAQSDDN